MRAYCFLIVVCQLNLFHGISASSFADADPSEFYEEGNRLCRDSEESREEVEYETTIYCFPDPNNTVRLCPNTEPVKACHTMYSKKCDITFRPHLRKVRVTICPGEKESVKLSSEESGGYRNNVVIDIRPGRRLAPKKSPCVDGKRKICVTKYETECSTVRRKKKMIEDHPRCQIEHLTKCAENGRCRKVPSMKCKIEKRQVTKVKPETSCRRIPRSFCRKVNCALEAEKKCYSRYQMVNEILPEETCNYLPQRVCHELDFKQEAVEANDVLSISSSNSTQPGVDKDGCTLSPAQKCERRQGNPKTVIKKLKKKICSSKAELEKQNLLPKLLQKRP